MVKSLSRQPPIPSYHGRDRMSELSLRAGNLDLHALSLTGDTPWQAGDEVVVRIDRADVPIFTDPV
jgi:hypothetical protein